MSAADARLPVHEAFYSWQGEGVHAGRAAFFIRLLGCPIRCPWCDSAGTWHPDFVPKEMDRRTVEELVAQTKATRAEFVVITGGEPAIHDLTPLTTALRAEEIPVHLETSGAFPLRGNFDWVTVSPKWQKLPLEENIARAAELKLIVEDAGSIARWMAFLAGKNWEGKPVWLHPEWSQRAEEKVLRSITEWVREKGAPFRAGWQLHKCYNADAADARSQPPVPLGGDEKRGF